MDVREPELLSLFRALDTLKPYVEDIVIVGGWVPFLYRKYGGIPARHPSVRTTDIDIAIPRQVPDKGRPTVNTLLSKGGYTVKVYGSESPPTVKYELADPATELEFITPEIGRPGKPSIFVQPGLTAQALRYVPILLENSRQIEIIDSISGLNINCLIRVPSPAAFIFQKALTLPQRHSKEAKDLYYIFDLLDSSSEMHRIVPSEIKSMQVRYPPGWYRSAIRNIERHFPESGGAGPTLVASQYTGHMDIEIFKNYSHKIFRGLIERLQ